MQTAGTFTQDTPNTDMQVMFDALEFAMSGATPQSGLTTIAGVNVPFISGTVSGTFTAGCNLSNLLLRTGIFAPSTAQTLSSQAFGTAAALPGPQAGVPATSSPSGFGSSAVVPPVLKANLPTIVGSVPGAKAKGMQINWVDLLYYPGATTPVTSITATLAVIQIPQGLGATPVLLSTPINAVTVSTAVQTAGKINRVRLTPTSTTMYTADGTLLELNVVIVYPAGGAAVLFGAILGCSYNFN